MHHPFEEREFESHEAQLRRFARRFAPTPQEEEDAVQDTWVSAIERPPERWTNSEGWLRTVLRFSLLRRRRQEMQRRSREHRVARLERIESDGEFGTDELLRVQEVVGSLAEPYRTVLRMRYFESLSIAQISERLGRPAGTVKSQLKRGLERVRREYGLAPELPHFGARQGLVLAFLGWLRRTTGRTAWARPAFLVLALVATVTGVYLSGTESSRAGPSLPSLAVARPGGAVQTPRVADAPERAALPTPSAPGPVTTAGLRIRAAGPDGEPVSALALELRRLADRLAASAAERVRRVQTGEDGEVILDELAPGPWRVVPVRGRALTVELEAGLVSTLSLDVPQGYDLAGRVVDLEGRPKAHASIWLSVPGDPADGRLAFETDAHGEFELHGLDATSWLGAEWEDLEPSKILCVGELVERKSGDDFELRLGQPTKTIVGSVVDVRGRPLAGARVTNSVRQLPEPLERGLQARDLRPAPRSVETDAEGAFRIVSIGSQLVVEAPGHAPWQGRVQAGPDPEVLVRVRLTEGTRLAGEVVDSDGRPLAGGRIRLSFPPPLHARELLADEDGRFVAEHVPATPVLVTARPKGADTVDGPNSPDSSRCFVPDPADLTGPLRLRLATDASVWGTLRANGGPLAGWSVSIEALDHDEARWEAHADRTLTNAAGGFAFPARPRVAHRLRIQAPGEGTPRFAEVVDPGRRLELTVTDRTGSIHGTFREDARLQLQGVALEGPLDVELDGQGRFELWPLPPGTYVLRAALPSGARAPIATFDLAQGEELDLGLVRLPETGGFAVRFRTSDGLRPARMFVHLVADGVQLITGPELDAGAATIDLDGQIRSEGLLPGTYGLRVIADGYGALFRTLEIASMRTTELELVLDPPIAVELAIEFDSLAPDEYLDIAFEPTDGGPAVRFDAIPSPIEAGTLEFRFRLAPGDYRVVSSSTHGLRGESLVRLAAGETPRAHVRMR